MRTGGLCCCRDFIATMTMALCLFLSVLCLIQTMSDAEYFSAAEDLRGEDWVVELWPKAPSPSFFDDLPAAEPPTSLGPPPMPDDAASDAQRSRRERGGRKVQPRRRNKAARQAAAAAAVAAAPLTKPATTSPMNQPRRHQNRRRRDPPLVIYRLGGGGGRNEQKASHREPARLVYIVDVHPDTDEFTSPPSSPEYVPCQTLCFPCSTAFERAF